MCLIGAKVMLKVLCLRSAKLVVKVLCLTCAQVVAPFLDKITPKIDTPIITQYQRIPDCSTGSLERLGAKDVVMGDDDDTVMD